MCCGALFFAVMLFLRHVLYCSPICAGLVNQRHHPINNNTESSGRCVDVFLGGSRSASSSWRENTAIPLLEKHGLRYYNPARCEGEQEEAGDGEETCVSDDEVLRWKETIDGSKVLLFVVSGDSRSLTTMILAAHYIGAGKKVVLCIEQLPEEECQLGSEKVFSNLFINT